MNYFSIYCYTNIIEDIELSFTFEGESNELELINFNENILNLKIHCQESITLILGEIKDQECRQYDSYSNYVYKITILNETLPNDLYFNGLYLQPINIDNYNNDNYYYTYCNLVNNDYNNCFECTTESPRIEGKLYHESNYIYETRTNDCSIMIKNINEQDLVIGEMINCYNENKKNYITLILGEIKDQECRQFGSYSNYVYKITIINETLPNNLYLNYINLHPNTFDNNNNYYIYCNLVNIDYNNYFECTIQYSKVLDKTIYYETNYTYTTWSNGYSITIKNINDNLYVGKNIICFNEHKLNYFDIIKGKCKNGAFLFSLDFKHFIKGKDKNSENNYKILLELKAKVDSKTFKNYCYLNNGNEDDEFDITKYKLNCAIPSFDEDNEDIKFYHLFSKFLLINYFAKEGIINDLYCYAPKKYITAFYYYHDICSDTNNFKIISFTTFKDNNIFNSTLKDKIEIPIISPFQSIAICQITSLKLEPFIEFNCKINNNGINITNYKNITFGNVTTQAYFDRIYPIEFDSFEGKKEFGTYCSYKKSKCSQLIESDYGINSENLNNPTVYQYSFCLISEKDSIFNKENFQLQFNDNTFGNCTIKNRDIENNNSTQTQLNCLANEDFLDKYPLFKNINPINFTFYNNIFNDINILTKNIIDITEIDLDVKITIKEVKDYICLNKNNMLLKLSASLVKPKSIIDYYILDYKILQFESFLNYVFIIDNSMNITFINSDFEKDSSLEILCLISGDFSYEKNITIKKNLNYKTFFNNFTLIWENDKLLDNIKCNNDEKIYIKENYLGHNFFHIGGYSLYNFTFYDDNGNNINEMGMLMKKNGIISGNVAICRDLYIYKYFNLFIFSINCEIYYNNITYGDKISFEVHNNVIKAQNGIELKIEGLQKLNYKYDYISNENYIEIFKSYNQGYCTEYGYFFNVSYYYNNLIYNYKDNDILYKYSIKNFINPINNETIEGECSFINYYYEENYYKYNRYLNCLINSSLIDIPYFIINNNYLDKNNNSLPNIYIYSNYDKPRIEFSKSFSCDKTIIFTINEIKDKNCLDGTYTFKMIGTLSNNKVNIINKVFIRDIIENDIQIFCNNLSYYENNNNIDYYSFNCYIVNDISNEYLNISLLDIPPFNHIISINYSSFFKKNRTIFFNYKCNNINKFKEFYNEFNSTLNLFYPYINNLFLDIDINIFSFKILIKIDKYPNNKIYQYYNKYMGNYLILSIYEPLGVAFCYLKDKNISRTTILECFGISGYYDYLEENEFELYKINSLDIYGDYNYEPNITFLGFIHKSLYDSDIEYPIFKINNISKGCINDKYNFNISGEIVEIDDEKINLNNSIPNVIKINLENDLYARCDIYKIKRNIKLLCNIISNNRLNNVDIKFNVSKLEIDEKNIIIDGLVDFLKTAQEIILDLNVNCGTMSPEESIN